MTSKAEICFVGAGNMGAAFARLTVTQNISTVVWARDVAKAASALGEDIRIEPSLKNAVAASKIIILLLSDYATVSSVLDEQDVDLSGRIIVNLVTGTRSEAKEFGAYVQNKGGAYLDGAILGYPEDVLAGTVQIYLSGDAEAWSQAGVLSTLSSDMTYLGEDVTQANALDAVLAGGFGIAALGAFVEAAAFAAACGISMDVLEQASGSIIGKMNDLVAYSVQQMKSGDYATDQATIDVYLAAVRAWRAQMIETGQRASFATANMHNLEVAQAAGLGDQGFAAQFLTCRVSASPPTPAQ